MELNKYSKIAQEKLTLTRRELQKIVVLTSTLVRKKHQNKRSQTSRFSV